MAFPNRPGAFVNIEDRSFVVSGTGLLTGAIVVTARKGPTETNLVTSITQLIEQYGEPNNSYPSLYAAERFLRRAGILNVIRVITDAERAQGALLDDTETHLEIFAANPGEWGNDIEVSFAELPNEPDGIFRLNVNYNGTTVETFDVSREETQKNGYGQNVYIENVINQQSQYITVDDYTDVTADYDLSETISLSGGLDDTASPSSSTVNNGWDAFSNQKQENANILINGGWATEAVQVKMVEVAENRTDCRAILDMPSDQLTAQDMIDYVDDTLGQDSYLAGIYTPWQTISDQYTGAQVDIPPSGDVAANFVQTVSTGNYWDAPAGSDNGVITGVLGSAISFTDGDLELFYTNNVNPIHPFNGANSVIMGQKTLQRASSALDRWNVVNNVLWIRERCVNALKPFVFTNNTPFQRQNVDFLLRSFLRSVQQRGGLYGFEIDVSENINTQQVIDNNEMVVRVFIQPVRAAERILVDLVITPTGVSFT